jgi:L-rhamnose mutarotase
MSLGSSDYSMGMAVGAVVGAAATAIACALTNLNSRNDDSNGNGVRLPVAGGGMAKAKGEPRAPQYHSGVIKVKEGMLDQYTALHDHTWDQVMAKMHEVRQCDPLRVPRTSKPRAHQQREAACTASLDLMPPGPLPRGAVQANMRNFVVYYHEELSLMFHHWEYVGDDFEADMAKCDKDPISKEYSTVLAAWYSLYAGVHLLR